MVRETHHDDRAHRIELARSINQRSVNVRDPEYGARGDGVTDDTAAIQAAFDHLATLTNPGALYFPAGIYIIETVTNGDEIFKLTSSHDGLRIFGDGYNSEIRVNVAVTGSPSTALFSRIADGDLFSNSAAGADNLTFENLRLNGNRAGSASYAGFSFGIYLGGGTGHIIRNIWTEGWEKGGIGIFSYNAEPDIECIVDGVYSTGNNGTGGQGISIATKGVDSGRLVINNAFCYDNTNATGIGIDISTGSATLNNCRCWGNGAGGCKTAGADDQKVIFNNCDFSDNTNTGAQGFYTNGTFGLIEMNGCRMAGNDSHGLQIAHAGMVLLANIDIDGNSGQGLYQSGDGDMIALNISSRNNDSSTSRGVLISAGDCQLTGVRTFNNGHEGLTISTTGTAILTNITSIDDCQTTSNVGINFAPGSSVTDKHILNGAHITDTNGSPNVTVGVNVNANETNASIGAVRDTGVTTTVSDSGTTTTTYG